MEPTQENFNALVHYLSESLLPDKARRRAGEEQLKAVSSRPGFLILLLRLQDIKTINVEYRLGAALYFKNFIRANWNQIDGEDGAIPISDADRAQIKNVLVDLMLSVESSISKTLAEALSIISDIEFPHDWQTLLPQLVSKFGSQDWTLINNVLKTIHSILRRYRHTFRSDTILGELKYILGQLQKPYHDLFMITMQTIATNINNEQALKTLFVTANLLCKIFYSLNTVDIPEFFEDNIATFMDNFRKFLHFQTSFPSLIEGDKEDTPGLLHKIQASVCVNFNLYIEKYEEEFANYLQTCVTDVWTLLAKTSNEPKVDRLVNAMIHFLTSVAKSVHHSLFAAEETLKQICGHIVIPNMKLRESDTDIFEDDPAEYVRRDSEGSDTDTRRRASLELVKGLRKHYEARVTSMFSQDITAMLAAGNWIAKDTAIYLVTALAVKSSTAAGGTQTINELIPVPDFCRAQILSEIQGPTKAPILRATCIKFITTFRQQLPNDIYVAAVPHLIALLRDPNYVIHSYAATCIERLLTVKEPQTQTLRIGSINDFIAPMLQNLFETLGYKESLENEYVMRAVTRIISVSGANIAPLAGVCLQQLVAVLTRVSQSSTNPTFLHYVFESIGCLIKNTSIQQASMVPQFESVLFPIFQVMLEKDISELMELAQTKQLQELKELEGTQPTPYILQIISLLLELSPIPISSAYAALFPPLVRVVMWERKSNVPALIRLVQAYLRKGRDIVVQGNHLPSILGIFQNKFNKSKQHDHEGFYLLEAIIEHLSLEHIDPYVTAIFTEIFKRLSDEKTKTLKYIKSFIVFLCLFIGKHGPSAVIARVNALQPNLFGMEKGILNSLLIPNVGKVNGKLERKFCCIGMIKLLTECPEMLTSLAASWPALMKALLLVIELPEDDSVNHGEFASEDDDDIEHSFTSAGFSPLSFAAKSDVDPFPVINPRAYLATQLHQLSQAQPAQLAPLLRACEPNIIEALNGYYKLAGIPTTVTAFAST